MIFQIKKTHPKYSSYRATGIPWLGEVPSGWEVKKLKNGFSFRKGKNSQIYTKEFIGDSQNQGDYPVYSGQTENQGIMGMVNNYEYDLEESIFVTTVGAKVMTPLVLSGKFSLSQNCALFFPKSEVLPKYFFYYLFPLFKQMKDDIPSDMQPSLRLSDLNKATALFPSPQEQTTIAHYLDKKTAILDQTIEAKQKQIELLKERRSSLINRAVTKGIDDGVEMKESGVEWIGEVPKGWEVLPLFSRIKEGAEKNIGNNEKNILSLSYGRIIRRDVETNFGLIPASFETYQIVKNGDIILRLTDLQNDKKSLRVGLVTETGIITSAYVCLKSTHLIISRYLYALLHSYDLEKVFYSLGGGVRQTMKFADLKRLPITIPSIQEQQKIVDYLDSKTQKIDETISLVKKSITLLQEYKTSLVSKVVTGKVKVIHSQ